MTASDLLFAWLAVRPCGSYGVALSPATFIVYQSLCNDYGEWWTTVKYGGWDIAIMVNANCCVDVDPALRDTQIGIKS